MKPLSETVALSAFVVATVAGVAWLIWSAVAPVMLGLAHAIGP